VFYHRSRHLHGAAHRTKYLAAHFPERLEDVKSVKYRVMKLLYHTAQVEEEDIANATTEAKSLRRLFNAVPKTGHRELTQAERNARYGVRPSQRGRGDDDPGRRGRGRDFAKRRNMNFDIDSVPYSRAPRRSRSPESDYRRERREGAKRGFDQGPRGVERKPLLSAAARSFLKNSDRSQENFPSGSHDPSAMTGLDHYGIQRSADRYASLGIRHPWEDPSALSQSASGSGNMEVDSRGTDTPEAAEALAALAVLEKFAGAQAQQDVSKKIDEMKRGVLSGNGIGADSIVAMAGSLVPSSAAPPPVVGYPSAAYPQPGQQPHGYGPPGPPHMPPMPHGPPGHHGPPSYPTDARGYPTYTNQPVGYGQPKPPPAPTYGVMNTGPQTKYYTKSKSGKEFMPITDALGGSGAKDYSAAGHDYNNY